MNFDSLLKISEAVLMLSISSLVIAVAVFVIVEFIIKGSR